jgi:hypothetical protein
MIEVNRARLFGYLKSRMENGMHSDVLQRTARNDPHSCFLPSTAGNRYTILNVPVDQSTIEVTLTSALAC